MMTLQESFHSARHRVFRILGWSAVGVGVLAAAFYAGYEIRSYRFRTRSPYQIFGHAGDDQSWLDSSEYGVGI